MLVKLTLDSRNLQSNSEKKQTGNSPSRRPAQGSKRAKCFEYAKVHYCKTFVSNLQRQNTERDTHKIRKQPSPNPKHQRPNFPEKSHCAEKPKRRHSQFAKRFFQTKDVRKSKVPFVQMIFPRKKVAQCRLIKNIRT